MAVSPQMQQLINLVFLLLLAKYTAYLYLPWSSVLFILFITVLLAETINYLKYKNIALFPYSSLSTAIGVMLMMVTTHTWILLTLIFFGLLQKHWLQIGERHFFNPSNFALILGLLLFYRDAHIVTGQLGDALWLWMTVVLIGLFILYRVNRWIIPVVFTAGYIFFQYIWVVEADPVMTMEEVIERFYSVSFIVFILFMLTDPRTTPQKYGWQIIFALTVSMTAALLDYFNAFRVQHLFLALFAISLWVPLQTLWHQKALRSRLVGITAVLFFLVLGAIITIENNPPYYFEMEG